MTTVAQSQFSTMEVPPGDDSMEMASPYQGHMDDFEIDLDVMEDQVSEVDQDLDVVDATPEPANGPGSIQGSVHDADMVDEIDERAMIDEDENNQQTVNHAENNYYQTEETYETQMVEEDYEEDIDAPIPDQQPEIVVTDTQLDQQIIQETSEFPERQEPTERDQGQEEEERHDEEVHLPEEDIEQHDLQQQPKEVEDHDTEEAAEESDSVNHLADQQSVPVELHETNLNLVQDERQPQEKELETAHVHETHVYLDQEADQVEEKIAHDTVDQGTEESSEVSHLHPVKVLYQDSEISLFPPREGDSSETFFLEDESLAHENLGKLLASCRGVLGEHVSEEEVLTVDIDALNLQLNEDSYYISKVTLSQIVGLYLDLCRNDGINEPEPLYLTLSTKPTLPAELSNLLAAAGEGKGLSHIHQWDEYEDGQEVGDSPVDEESEVQEPGKLQLSEQAALAKASEQQQAEEEQVEQQLSPKEGDTKDHAPSGVHEGDETEAKSADAAAVSAYEGQKESALVVTDVQDEQQQEGAYEQSGEPNEEGPEAADAGPEDGQYDYEEEASESTATLAHVSVDELKVETVTEESVKQFVTGPAEVGENEKVSAVEDFIGEGEEVYDEHQDYEEGADEHGEYELRQYESLGVPQDGQEEQSTADQDQTVEPEKAVTAPDQTLEIPGDDYEEFGAPQPQDEEPELNEDLLGIDEDIFKSPGKKSKLPSAPLTQEESEHGIHAEDAGDEYEELPSDGEDYIDLGTTETDAFGGEIDDGMPELRGSGPAGKRPRGPEDEVDLAETPSPDAKRRRSS